MVNGMPTATSNIDSHWHSALELLRESGALLYVENNLQSRSFTVASLEIPSWGHKGGTFDALAGSSLTRGQLAPTGDKDCCHSSPAKSQ